MGLPRKTVSHGSIAHHFPSQKIRPSPDGASMTTGPSSTSQSCVDGRGARLGCLADYQGRLGGEYGSGVPSWIGGYFSRLSENSATIFVTGATTHELCQTTSSRCSFKSVRRLMTFGSGRVTAGSYMFSCQIKCTFQFRHLTANNRSPT